MNRLLASIAVLAAILVAALLAWRTGRMAQIEREKVTASVKAVQAAREAERLEAEASARPGETLVERLRVEPPVVDFGDLLPDIQVSRSVRLHNIGDRPIRVLRAVADCGCTTPSVPLEPIPVGASIETEISVRPGVTQGSKLSKRVTYEVEGALPAFCMVEGTVGTYIRFTPTALDAPVDGRETGPGEITLESALGIPFTVTDVEPSIDADAPVEASARQVIWIDWKLWREAGRPMQVTITTDHAGAPPMTVVIRRHDEP